MELELDVNVDKEQLFTELLSVQSADSIIDHNIMDNMNNNFTVYHIPLINYSVNTINTSNNTLNEPVDVDVNSTLSFFRSANDEYFNADAFDLIVSDAIKK